MGTGKVDAGSDLQRKKWMREGLVQSASMSLVRYVHNYFSFFQTSETLGWVLLYHYQTFFISIAVGGSLYHNYCRNRKQSS